MPTPRDNYERLLARAKAAHSNATDRLEDFKALGKRDGMLALMTVTTLWGVVDNLSQVLGKLTPETARTAENDALLEALRIATEGLEDCVRVAAMVARDAGQA